MLVVDGADQKTALTDDVDEPEIALCCRSVAVMSMSSTHMLDFC